MGVRLLSTGLQRSDVVVSIRHLSVALAATLAFLFSGELPAGDEVLLLLILGLSTALYVPVLLGSRRAGCRTSTAFTPLTSFLFGLLAWSTLVHVTGGVGSPLMAGFGLEALLIFPFVLPRLSSAVRAQRPASPPRRETPPIDALAESEELARFAHSLKNSVNCLRGFAQLLEPKIADRRDALRALEGLRVAIDQVEELSRSTLESLPRSGVPGAGNPCRCDLPPSGGLAGTIEEATRQVSVSYPGVCWLRQYSRTLPEVAMPRPVLREVLVDLLRNAAEAMGGRGEVRVKVQSVNGTVEIQVHDRGRGISESDLEKLFLPGYTTKANGNGFGLFLARNILKRHGGDLKAAPKNGCGAVFSATVLREEKIP